VEIDSSSGYRFYAPSQVATAQTIRRLRELDMPLDEVRALVQTDDPKARDAALIAHLQRMEAQLEQTQQTVASLRGLLEQPEVTRVVVRRKIPATPALAIREVVPAADGVAWWMAALTLLHSVVNTSVVNNSVVNTNEVNGGLATRAGVDGALFSTEFFTDELGEVTVFIPVESLPAADAYLPDRVIAIEIPAIEAATTVHDGPFSDLDRTYGALGTWVLEQAAGAPGPIREYYLPTGDPEDLIAHTTEVCWPVK
jgi:DNA-binding transcriptional MerR regulator/effector-binding domain-containing protein